MSTATPVRSVVRAGIYLTDGKRLVTVLHVSSVDVVLEYCNDGWEENGEMQYRRFTEVRSGLLTRWRLVDVPG